ncbi:hypothetical protein SAMN05192548_1008159 [Paraburkholderia terricola]|jgi:hypothetical protein|uniref:Uncharacterized protein n=1 Tax=Paraburkholderia terricola TaxID=169427 RepID=A0A1M6MW22_9BURK|nr:hypothetical protein SAMN05192547_100844 [Paraburkholderia sediminicola]SHJ87616.1 hypothetical protein SAMN05192548_1008159 [Paraburkholderia terricola]
MLYSLHVSGPTMSIAQCGDIPVSGSNERVTVLEHGFGRTMLSG